MNIPTAISHSLTRRLSLIAAAATVAACADNAPVKPEWPQATAPSFSVVTRANDHKTLAEIRRVTARYHDLDRAIADGFVFLHGCEVRTDEGPVGTVYINFQRLLDGEINPKLPDGLIYEPRVNRPPRLVAVEFAVPYTLWTQPQPPTFQGATFQREDEFGVFGLHVWVWRHNPNGLFAETNPKVTCTPE